MTTLLSPECMEIPSNTIWYEKDDMARKITNNSISCRQAGIHHKKLVDLPSKLEELHIPSNVLTQE